MEQEIQNYTTSDRYCGTTFTKLRNWLKEIGTETQITELQKTVLRHTA